MNYLARQTRNNILLNLLSIETKMSQSKYGKIINLSQQMVSKIIAKHKTSPNTPSTIKGAGRPSRLSSTDLSKLPDLLLKGAPHYGFEGDYWTRARVKHVIEKELGIIYEVKQVGRILKKLHWTLQKPQKKTFSKTCKK
jgi:transposase